MDYTPPHPASGMRVAAKSDVGMRRPQNQDAFVIRLAEENEVATRGHLFVVADGMGAHAAGELASQLAVEHLSAEYCASSERSASESLLNAMRAANSVIHQRGQEDTQLYNMGTTCSSLAIVPEGAVIGHVGDSRVYRWRKGIIQQLTFDHSLVWEMRAAGQCCADTSTVPRNVITRCLGPHVEVDADVEGPFSIRDEDVFVLCSDGLSGRVNDEEIGTIAGHLPPESASQFLVDLANLRGGSDNITVMIVQVAGDKLAASGSVPDQEPESVAAGTHPLWWLLAGTGLLVTVIAFQMNQMWAAATALGIGIVACLGAALQWFQLHKMPATPSRAQAPYANATAKISRTFVDAVSATLSEVLTSFSDHEAKYRELASRIEVTRQDGGLDESTVQELANLARTLIVMIREDDVER